MKKWSIGFSDSQKVSVELLSPPDNTDEYKWIRSRVDITVGGFRGQANLSILLQELELFRDQLTVLQQSLKGEAEFTTIENQLYLKLKADHLGHIGIEGYVMDDAGVGNKLDFSFEIDQSFLKSTLDELVSCIQESKK
jgi:hypothetical protein